MNSRRASCLWLLCGGALCATAPATAAFTDGTLFVSSSLTDQVRMYDATTLGFVGSFTHPEFGLPVSGSYADGPNGLAFNARGNLVVAAHGSFVEFSAPGVQVGQPHAKHSIEANETLLFDRLGNLYTTTSTGGTNQLDQYDANFVFRQTIALPAASGSLTGITLDDKNRLFVASQRDNKIYVLQADAGFSAFAPSLTIAGANASNLEGLQINQNGELIAAGGNITRYNAITGAVLGSFDAVPDTDVFPVGLTVDNDGNIFTADFENGIGSAPADIVRFSANGSTSVSIKDPQLYGPFGLAIAGTTLPGGPPPVPEPPVAAMLAIGLLGLALLRLRAKGK
jgi:sugar lactone lactonase YvrE